MDQKEYVPVPQRGKERFISTIVEHFPEEKRKAIEERLATILKNYDGIERVAMRILYHATIRERFDEFASELEKHYDKSLQFMNDPDVKRYNFAPGAKRARKFFVICYNKLGFKTVLIDYHDKLDNLFDPEDSNNS